MKLIKDLGTRFPTETSKRKRRYGLYECAKCNKEFETIIESVKYNNTSMCNSCGRKAAKSHGLKKHPLYAVWHGIKQRCYNPKSQGYHRYGGLGVEMCKEWREGFMNFYNWAITSGWESGLHCSRFNDTGNYSPGNCEFKTNSENSAEGSTRNRYGSIKGIKLSNPQVEVMIELYREGNNYNEIALMYGVNRTTVSRAIKNYKK